jgi:uncharacterized membrane protein YkoI
MNKMYNMRQSYTSKLFTLTLAAILVIAMSSTVFAASTANITQKKAVSIALKDAGLKSSQVYGLEAERDGNRYEVEFHRSSNKAEYSYDISRARGTILEKSVEYKVKKSTSKKKIGVKKARMKVAKFSGISYKTIKKGSCRYEYDDRHGEYTVKFRKGDYRYKYELLAPNGKILEYEKERI